MKYLLLLMSLLFLTACSPKYKIVQEYIPPSSDTEKTCIQTCQEELATCKAVCKSNFDICKVKAEKIAKQNYHTKLNNYYRALEKYANDVQMYDLESELFYYHDFYYPRSYYGYRSFWGPHWIWGPPIRYHVKKPVKPNLAQEIQMAQLQFCEIDCKCTPTYERCFTGCGGKVINKKICIENCPK